MDPLRSGQPLAKSTTADIDQFQLAPLLSTACSCSAARRLRAALPPRLFRSCAERYWEVWQRRTPASPPVLAHLPLGNVVQPGGVPTCASIHRLTRLQGVRALEAVPVENPIVVAVGKALTRGVGAMIVNISTLPVRGPPGYPSASLGKDATKYGWAARSEGP